MKEEKNVNTCKNKEKRKQTEKESWHNIVLKKQKK